MVSAVEALLETDRRAGDGKWQVATSEGGLRGVKRKRGSDEIGNLPNK